MKIGRDKWKHFAAGFLVSFLTVVIASIFTTNILILALGVGTSTVVGIAKEVYDKVSKKGTPDIMDAVFTTLGGIAASCVLLGFY